MSTSFNCAIMTVVNLSQYRKKKELKHLEEKLRIVDRSVVEFKELYQKWAALSKEIEHDEYLCAKRIA